MDEDDATEVVGDDGCFAGGWDEDLRLARHDTHVEVTTDGTLHSVTWKSQVTTGNHAST